MLQKQAQISLDALIEMLPGRSSGISLSGLNSASSAYVAARISAAKKCPLLLLTADNKSAQKMATDLSFFLEEAETQLLTFPAYALLPFKHIAYHNEIACERIAALYHLFSAIKAPIVIAPIAALMQLLIPKKEIVSFSELLMVGEEVDRDQLVEKLLSGGYERCAIVEQPGEFCIRGGILDLFSPLHQHPLRVEFYGDTVDALRFFSPETQRKTLDVDDAVILPAREFILPKEKIGGFIERLQVLAQAHAVPTGNVRKTIDRIQNEGLFPGIESYSACLFDKLDTLFDFLPGDTLIGLVEPADIEQAAHKLWKRAQANFNQAIENAKLCIAPEKQFLNWNQIKKLLVPYFPLCMKSLQVSRPVEEADTAPLEVFFSLEDNAGLTLALKQQIRKSHLFAPLVDSINDYQQHGYAVLIVCSSRGQANRLYELLKPYGIEVHQKMSPDFDQPSKGPSLLIGRISSGFVWAAEGIALIAGEEIFGGQRRAGKQSRQGAKAPSLSFEELKQDQLIVHADHGVGRYQGIVKLELGVTINDFMTIVYRDDDKLYLPIDRMGMIQKYMGVDGITPILDKMGGKSWAQAKSKVKKSVRRIAGELLRLYAQRKVEKGFSFAAVDDYFHEFEAGFAHEETEDQLQAIQDVLADMRRSAPMDRLICGDVGYGKTEVALRASFVAVNDNKQVVFLVPTTVLAEQHYTTFSRRFERYPVTIAKLTRFRTPKEQREIVESLASGKIDIVIGTHRLLQKDITFKDLGLVVLDEEQRFGVRHKEKLKKFKSAVDVLALTATPIPRTLHMSLVGVRDISIIATPPMDRRSINTYISEYDEVLVAEAIRKEMDRKGQIFFIHNSINTIQSIAERLSQLVPEVRLDIAHGRMNANALEKVMLRFLAKEIDLLVCTTIVESGLDIPSANTMLVNRADRFGLSQIYQLRGRVGRSDEQAYAYLFVPDEERLSKTARKRLKVLMEHSELGSGYQIAMNDLRIRGGGTILGASQSGHIASVGYDMFLKLMEETACELKGQPKKEPLEPEINLPLATYLPETYISDIDQRLSIYRRLSRMTLFQEVSDMKTELADRYGPLPLEASHLLFKFVVKLLCLRAGIKQLDLSAPLLMCQFSEIHQSRPFGIVALIAADKKKYTYTSEKMLKVRLFDGSLKQMLAETKNVLKEISQHVNA